MSEAPETIWVEAIIIGAEDGSHGSTAWATHDPDTPDIEYRRADLAATDAQAFANEKVKALAEVAKRIVGGKTFGVAHPNHADLAAALAALEATNE